MAASPRRSRGHIETRASGRFRVKVYAGDDPLTGKQNYLTKTTNTYREAEVELTKLLGQVDETSTRVRPSRSRRWWRSGWRSSSW